ncbi:hypothetical protein [Pseudonocardia hydrocarbonoxydans]|uniref:hypothetical protein n=1 Tax=Pseudonocardia hydrocarbonoxydans TaxID=76726 RepID=UPI0031D17FB7
MLAPRAAAFEPRVKALVAYDGIYDFAAAMVQNVAAAPAPLLQLLQTASELVDAVWSSSPRRTRPCGGRSRTACG